MARYSIKITFNLNPNDQDPLVINDGATEMFRFRFMNTTLQPNDVSIVSGIIPATVGNLYSSFQAIYNGTGQYSQTANGQVWEVIGEFTNTPTITEVPVSITSEITQLADPMTIVSMEIQANGNDPCNWVNILVTANKPFTEITSPVQETFAATTTYTIQDRIRANLTQVSITDGTETASDSVLTPDFLDPNLFYAEVVGPSVIISDYIDGLTLQYSINGVDWQDSNVFNGLAEGTHTVYIRDNLGCQISIEFEVVEAPDGTIKLPDPYFLYPEENPIRFARREEWDDCAILKNDYNTLSCEQIDRLTYREIQRFRSCDTLYFQFRNNYSDIQLIPSHTGTPLALEQKTQFLNNKEAMDCKIVELADNTRGIYFLSGNYYNYDTLAPTGETYYLNGELPTWAIQGGTVTIGGLNYEIIEIGFNQDLQVNQIVISGIMAAGDYIVKALYHYFDYEVYEASLPLAGITEEFWLEFHFNGELQYMSEIVLVDDERENLVKVQYYMDYNTNMFWASGIQPYIRLHLDTSVLAVNRTPESYQTDTDVMQIDIQNYRQNVFTFFPVTKELARKIILIFSSSHLNINGIDYVCSEITPESLGASNLYVLTATTIERGSGLEESRSGVSTITLSNLVKGNNNGYVKL